VSVLQTCVLLTAQASYCAVWNTSSMQDNQMAIFLFFLLIEGHSALYTVLQLSVRLSHRSLWKQLKYGRHESVQKFQALFQGQGSRSKPWAQNVCCMWWTIDVSRCEVAVPSRSTFVKMNTSSSSTSSLLQHLSWSKSNTSSSSTSSRFQHLSWSKSNTSSSSTSSLLQHLSWSKLRANETELV